MKPVIALALLVVLLGAACGGSDDDPSGDGTTTSRPAGGSAAGGGPVTIEHRYGETTLDAVPQRIVALDNQWLDVLTALDAPVVGAALDPNIESGRYPWQDVVADSVEGIPVGDAIPYEGVAALRPDLIVVTWAVTAEADYDRLSAIAPTIPLLGDAEVETWEDIATTAGEVLRRPDDAAQLIDDTEQLASDVAEELPGLDGKTYALANYVPGDAIYVVADPDDGASAFFSRLGLQIDPDLLEIADGASGRVELSLERVDELDADLLLILTNGAEPEEIPGWDNLPAVRSDAVAAMDLASVSGLNTPSPLSLPYSLDVIRPALEAAADD